MHNSLLYPEKTERVKAQRVSRPPYIPDPATSDFFVFGYVKKNLCGTLSTTSDDLIFVIWQIFSKIPQIIVGFSMTIE
jgi:hypothetical protein